MNDGESAQVVIAGAGPVGLTLANLLGQAGIHTVIVERNPTTVPEPRAIALDGESLRTLQAAGLADVVLPTIREGFIADYLNGDGVELFRVDLNPRPYGFCLQNSFDQPTLERQLLDGLSRFDCVEVRFSTELVDFSQDEQGVSVSIRDAGGGDAEVLHSDFLVGCDGGRSRVRQKLGISMEGDRLPQRWLVIDTVDNFLTDEPQCRFYCDPARPGMTMLRPGRERRWEWMLADDESDEEMLDRDRVDELLSAHTDPKQVRVYRKCVYGFSAVVASRFSEGRVFLAGDAAHMTPPFAGQGLNAGVRDVRNLSWKLVSVLRGQFTQLLLDSYQRERHDAARELVDMAVELGDQIQPIDLAAAGERDAMFAELNKDPAVAQAFSRDAVAPLFDVRLASGWMADDPLAGRMLPQPVLTRDAKEVRLDDTLDSGFVALVPEGVTIPEAVAEHAVWKMLAPSQSTLPDALHDFAAESPRAVLLLRPDRFVLAALDLQGDPGAVLDRLQTQLAAT